MDLTLCFITSQIQWQESNDVVLQPKSSSGIKKQSLIRVRKIATLDRSLALGRIGTLDPDDIKELNSKLKLVLQLVE